MSWRIEKNKDGADIVIDGFEKGIADSPYEGISDMRNANIISIPDEASVNFKTVRIDQTPIANAAFTVVAATDTFTYSGTQLKIGTVIQVRNLVGGAGLATSTNYWVRSATATTFTLSASVSASGNVGALLNVTTDGSGTFTTTNLSLFVQIEPLDAANTNPRYYGIDTDGRVWVYRTSSQDTNWIYLGNTVTANTPPDFNVGLSVWNGYIFALYNGASGIGIYTCATGLSSAVFTFFKGLANQTTHRTFIDKNNTLYWCDSNQIGSLIELTTFNPATPATYTYSAAALLIQKNDTAQCMGQLGVQLLIGGLYNQIYQWDRYSTGYNPILLPEANTHRMITVNATTYIFIGTRGRIYKTNGANAELYRKMPDHLSGTVEPKFVWGGAAYNKNQLFFALTAFSPVGNVTEIPNYGGIWAIDTDTEALSLVNQLSYGTYAGYVSEVTPINSGSNSFITGSGLPVNSYGIITGWEDTTASASPNYGSDITAISTTPSVANVPYDNYETYVDSDMIPIGTYLSAATDANVEFKLTVPMVSGEGVKMSYRQNLSQSFTPIVSASRPTGEFTSADGFSGVMQVNFQKSQWLQIRIFTKSTSTNPSYTRLRELRIR